jgi:hypothetical protein
MISGTELAKRLNEVVEHENESYFKIQSRCHASLLYEHRE